MAEKSEIGIKTRWFGWLFNSDIPIPREPDFMRERREMRERAAATRSKAASNGKAGKPRRV